jgi:hypothetical protein
MYQAQTDVGGKIVVRVTESMAELFVGKIQVLRHIATSCKIVSLNLVLSRHSFDCVLCKRMLKAHFGAV